MAIEEKNSRTAMMIGEDGVNLLREKHVLIFGLGGVGGILTEALARAGVGHLTIVDKDTVSESNLNRQVIALRSSIGRAKTAVMRERLLDIDPTLDVTEKCVFYLPETADAFDFSEYDYIVDAVDTVTAKLLIIENARKAGVEKRVHVAKRDIRDFKEDFERAAVICNPPYGERLLDMEQARELYKVMGEKFPKREGWSYSIISPDDNFENIFGRPADKRRKLYNGMIKCQVYMYFRK